MEYFVIPIKAGVWTLEQISESFNAYNIIKDKKEACDKAYQLSLEHKGEMFMVAERIAFVSPIKSVIDVQQKTQN